MNPLALLSVGTEIYKAFTGKKKDEVTGEIVKVGKGLLGSRTANVNHATLIMKCGAVIAGVAVMPDRFGWLVWPGIAAVFIEWGVNLYLRAITKEPVK